MSEAAATSTEVGRKAARGVLSVGSAKLFFALAGFVTTWLVPRVLDSAEAYGRFTTAMTALAILTNTLTTASVQTSSKLLSEGGADVPTVLRRTWLAALGIGVVSGGLFAALGPGVATWVFGDASLVPLLSLGGVALVSVPLYATGIGALNGARRFGAQARLDAGYSTARTAGILGGAALGLGAIGALGGYVLATATLAIAAVAVVGLGRPGAGSSRYAAFFVPLAVATLAQNGVLQLDVEILKAVHAAALRGAGETAERAAALASSEVGIYRAAQTLAFVPYQLSIALTMVVFPFVSRATSTDDAEGARRTVRNALRFATLWLVLCEAPLAGAGGRAIDLVFPADYVAGADALGVLAVSQVLFALFALACTVLSGAGRPWHAAGAALAGLLVVVAGGVGGVFFVGADGPVRVVAALAATGGAAVGLGVALAMVRALLGAVLPWATFFRAVGAGLLAFVSAHAVPLEGAVGAIAALAAGAIVYLGVLGITGELAGLRPERR